MGEGVVAYLHVSWCTHGNDVIHICMESWDALVVKYDAKVKISGNDTLRRIFIYIPSTLPDRRKANPGFTNSPFKNCRLLLEEASRRHPVVAVLWLPFICSPSNPPVSDHFVNYSKA